MGYIEAKFLGKMDATALRHSHFECRNNPCKKSSLIFPGIMKTPDTNFIFI